MIAPSTIKFREPHYRIAESNDRVLSSRGTLIWRLDKAKKVQRCVAESLYVCGGFRLRSTVLERVMLGGCAWRVAILFERPHKILVHVT
jgi:hypothetical protein